VSIERRSVTPGRLSLVDPAGESVDIAPAPSLPQVTRRFAALCITALGALVLASCDTGDGKQLQPYDPADYPSQTVATTVTDASVDQFVVPTADGQGSLGGDPDANAEAFSLAAPWLDGGDIDPRYTCDGENVAPALSWGAVPPGTVELAIALVDDSAVSDGQPFVHWVIAGLDPAEIALVEGDVPPGALQALNFFGDVGYGGPCPPPGDEPHQYRLTAYALNQQLELADGDPATEFLDVIATITLASTDVIGFSQR
jgi:Raf kinase inhibitor-like YbhB/YbcL family protein